MSHFEGHFEGAKTFLTPQIVPSAARDNLGVKKVEQPRARARATKAGKNVLYWHDEPNKPSKEGHLSYVLQESPFASVSTVSRGHSSLVSLVKSPTRMDKPHRL